MLKTVRRAFQIEDIRKRILYTFAMLIVVRLGSQLPTPGVDPTFIQDFFASQTGDAFNFFEAFTGGSFSNMSIFALSITPYITSSIIMQLLTIAIPKLEEMQKEGEDGRKKIAAITRYVTVALALIESIAIMQKEGEDGRKKIAAITRYVTVALALIESIAMAVGFGRQGLLEEYNFVNCAIVVCTLTAGSAFLMWIGERITEKGVGNGISIVLLINILSRIPEDFVTLYTQFISGKTIAQGALAAVIIVLILLAVIIFVVVLQSGERRIAVQYSKKVQGRKMYGGQSTHIPLRVNTAGVIPVIFSSSLMQTPIVIAQFLGKGNGTGIGSQILAGMNSNNWCDPQNPIYSIGLLIYIVLTVFFAYFYTSITFNPLEIANNFFNGVFGANVSFGGTSLIIIVGVVLETIKKIESQMLVRNYTGFLNNKGSKMKNSYLGY